MDFAIIGLGRFGLSIARTLIELEQDVLGIDILADVVQRNRDELPNIMQLDSTDEDALQQIGITNFDVVVVAIGQDMEDSILTTAILQELGVKKIVAKANSHQHGRILEKVGAHKVIYPERDMGIRLAHSLVAKNFLDFIELSDAYSIVELNVPKFFIKKSLKQLNLRSRYGINVLGIRRGSNFIVSPKAEEVFQEGDVILVLGNITDLQKLEEK